MWEYLPKVLQYKCIECFRPYFFLVMGEKIKKKSVSIPDKTNSTFQNSSDQTIHYSVQFLKKGRNVLAA